MSETDLTRNLNPVCPHCGHEERDAWEIDFGSGLEGEAEISCGRCEKDYIAERVVDVSYTTRKLKR
jgi:hypothetical protein